MKIRLRDVALLCIGILIGTVLMRLWATNSAQPAARIITPDNVSHPSQPRHEEEDSGNTLASGELRQRAVRKILEMDLSKSGGCSENRKIGIKPISFMEPGVLTERWSVRRCGSVAFYNVQFSPTPQGEIEVAVSVE